MKRNRKLRPMTGDPTIDAFAKMGNDNIRKKRKKAPAVMNVVEHKLIGELLPVKGIGRIVCDSKQSAEYVKIRLRKFLFDLGINEMIASSIQHNVIIAWKIAEYNMWRLKQPVEETQVWKDAQAEDVTLYQTYSKSRRNLKEDNAIINSRVKDISIESGDNPLATVKDLKMLKEILEGNYESEYITKEEFDIQMESVNKEIERRNK